MTPLRPRPDAAAKLTGDLVYLTDRIPPGCLAAAVLRSPHSHATIRAVRTAAAASWPGVRAVLTAADLPADLLIGIRVRDQPILATGKVRHVGEAVAAVAADTPEIARAALALIEVDYEPLPVLDDPETALAPGATPLHPRGNLCHATAYTQGDLAETFVRSIHVIETVCETPRQMHAALELEGAIAIPGGNRLTLLAPSQHPHGVRDVVARVLGWAPERVDVVGSPLGGGYGGKEDVHVQPLAALLAVRSGRPVRLVMSRTDSIDAGFKRHPFRIRMRTGCDAAGRLMAHEVEMLADTGAYASHGPEVLDTAHECAPGPYGFAALSLRGRLAYTNNGVSGAFRGFGALQVQVALEMQIDRLARRLGVDPAAFRLRNLRRPDARGPLGQVTLPQPEVAVVARRLADHPMRRDGRRPPGDRHVTGIGTALVSKGEGFAGGGPNGAEGTLALAADGRIEFRSGLVEMGQGLGASVTTLLAGGLGVAIDDARAVLGDTCHTADSGPTSASRGTQIAARLIRSGLPHLRRALLDAAATELHLAPQALAIGAGGIYVAQRRSNAPALAFADLARRHTIAVAASAPPVETFSGHGASHTLFTACGATARIAVDRCTGRVTVERLLVVPACGPVLVPEAFQGQMEGAAAMALGFAFIETLPAVRGRFSARNLDRYLVPMMADMPPVDVEPVEELDPDDPVGLRGAGEIAINAVGPALACAVLDAVGEAPSRFPVDPCWVLAALDRPRAR